MRESDSRRFLQMIIGGIGSRETPIEVLDWIENYSERLVKLGHSICTGNAPGADQAWARGANKVDPTKVILCVPWRTYEEQAVVPGNHLVPLEGQALDRRNSLYNIAATLHPAWPQLTLGGQKLHARNVMIATYSQRVIGYLNHAKKGGGGTGMGFRAAERMRIPAFDISNPETRKRLDAMIP